MIQFKRRIEMRPFINQTALFVLLILIINTQFLNAQPGPSFTVSYDLLPYSNLTDLEKGTFEEDLKIRIATLKLKASYPQALSKETFLMHEISYDRFDMDYEKWDALQGGARIDHAHAIKYNLMIMHQWSEKWSLLAFITPGLASDFKSKLSSDDVSIEAAIVFIRKYSEQFSLGFGAAFSRQFGEPFPLPVLAIEWNNGSNLRASAIIPASLELWYRVNQNMELGLVMAGDGNMYHGDERKYGGTKPRMKYSVLTFGPSLKYRFTKVFSLNVDAGYTFLRRFEFTNKVSGKSVKKEYDLENNGFIKVGFQIGG
jgi:hypothetical protein